MAGVRSSIFGQHRLGGGVSGIVYRRESVPPHGCDRGHGSHHCRSGHSYATFAVW